MIRAVPKIIDTCRALRAHLQAFSKSPMLTFNQRGKAALEATDKLLGELEDLADRVELLERAQAS